MQPFYMLLTKILHIQHGNLAFSIDRASAESMAEPYHKSLPMDALISDSHPYLQNQLERILDTLIGSYIRHYELHPPSNPVERQRVEKYAEILKSKSFSVHLLQNDTANAFCYRSERRIYITTGLFRSILEAPSKLHTWDTLTFILGHEIGHVIFDEGYGYSEKDKNDPLNKHHMEDQCDLLGLKLSDIAGYSVKFADFSIFGESEISVDSQDWGILETHPNMYQRDRGIKNLVYTHRWLNYHEKSQNQFNDQTVSEIKKDLFQETLYRNLDQKSNDPCTGILRGLRNILRATSQDCPNHGFAYPTKVEEYRDLNDEIIEKDFEKDFQDFFEIYKDTLKEGYAKVIKEIEFEPNGQNRERDFQLFSKYVFLTNLRESYTYHLNRRKKTIIFDSFKNEISKLNISANLKKAFLMGFGELLFLKRLNGKNKISVLQLIKILEELPYLSLLEPPSEETKLAYEAIVEEFKENFSNMFFISTLKQVSINSEKTAKDFIRLIKLGQFNFGANAINKESLRTLKLNSSAIPHLGEAIKNILFNEDPYFVRQFISALPDSIVLKVIQDKQISGYLIEHGIFKEILENCGISYSELSKKISPLFLLNICKTHSGPDMDFYIKLFRAGLNHFPAIVMNEFERAIPEIIEHIKKDYPVDEQDKLLWTLANAFYKFKLIKNPVFYYEDYRELLAMSGKVSENEGLFKFRNPYEKDLDDSFASDLSYSFGLAQAVKSFSDTQLKELIDVADSRSGYDNYAILFSEYSKRFNLSNPLIRGDLYNIDFDGNLNQWRDIEPRRQTKPFSISRLANIILPSKQPHTNEEYQFLIQKGTRYIKFESLKTYLKYLSKNNLLNDELLQKITSWCDSNCKTGMKYSSSVTNSNAKDEVPKVHMDEYFGEEISQKDYAYFIYFKLQPQKIKELAKKSIQEKMEWFKTKWPDKSPYRDVLIFKIFQKDLENPASIRQQMEIINLFHSPTRSAIFRNQVYQKNKQRFMVEAFEKRLKFLLMVFPWASPERDLLIEELLSNGSCSPQNFSLLYSHLSHQSHEFQKHESIYQGTFNTVFSRRMLGDDRRELIFWLLGIKKEFKFEQELMPTMPIVPRSPIYNFDNKINFRFQNNTVKHSYPKPKAIWELEKEKSINLDSMKALMVIETARHELLDNIFAGNEGLFATENSRQLDEVIEQIFKNYFPANNQSKSAIALNEFCLKVFQTLMKTNNQNKKMRVLNRLFDYIFSTPHPAQAGVIYSFLEAYGTVGIKLGQILSSQPGIKKDYPELHQALSTLQDNSSPMTFVEALLAIDRNELLKKHDVKIIRRLGSASIKGVFEIEIDGVRKVMKVARSTAIKDLDQEEIEFKELIQLLEPNLITFLEGMCIPDYSLRIFNSIREEVDFQKEIQNSKALGQMLESITIPSVIFYTPNVDEKLSNEFMIIEDVAKGTSIKNYTQNAKSSMMGKLNSILQNVLLKMIFIKNLFHGDPHAGNIFIHEENGKVSLGFIDSGLIGKFDQKEDINFILNLIKVAGQARVNSFVSLTVLKNIFPEKLLKYVFKKLLPQDLENLKLENWIVSPESTQQAFLNIIAEVLPPSLYAQHRELLTKQLDGIQKYSPNEQILLVFNALDNLPGYQVPESIMRVLIAISKTPYLFDLNSENSSLYSEILNLNTEK